jgi:hypothetical protein
MSEAPQVQITIVDKTRSNDASPRATLVEAVRTAFDSALLRKGKVSDALLSIDGMSGQKYRIFINNLIGLMFNPRYLEIGVWSGSTLCSAIYENAVSAVAIDNWSQYGGPSKQFFANLAQFAPAQTNLSFLNSDFRAVDCHSLAKAGKFNVYLFDGPRERKDQCDGVTIPLSCLTDESVFIVDDWIGGRVRDGTLSAIKESGLEMQFCIEVRMTFDGSHPTIARQYSEWHNGYFISVLTKRPSDQPSKI